MNVESLFEEAIMKDDRDQLERSIELVMNEWLYFFMWEKPGKNTPASSENVVSIITTGKDNPISIPLIKDAEGGLGVLYFTQELAAKSAEFNCKVGKMKGRRALAMFKDLAGVDAVAIQSTNEYNVRIPIPEIERVLEAYA
jgi:hypothetical protein